VEATARPATRPRSGLAQLGLPYAADPAITRHLAAFLARQAAAAAALGAPRGRAAPPDPPALNGGVTKAPAFRERLLAVLNGWLAADGAPPVRVLPGEDPDLAVARGAAYFALVRRGRGLRIRGGTARAYYVGIESPTPPCRAWKRPSPRSAWRRSAWRRAARPSASTWSSASWSGSRCASASSLPRCAAATAWGRRSSAGCRTSSRSWRRSR
jgi:hypothetical protein